MAKKPNYRFERQERERLKAEKKAAREAERIQRKVEEGGAAEADAAAAPAAAATGPTSESGPVSPSAPPPQYSGPPIAIRPIETMTPSELETLRQNARRLAASGSARQKAAAQDLLPRLEAALEKIAEEKRQTAAAKMAQAMRKVKSE
ncbi:MAG: hypothetical protein JNL66_11665 [Alphaproteobacteria bacterium]|nr:hypothetical protein [Alphaproteobacteria bacterium]